MGVSKFVLQVLLVCMLAMLVNSHGFRFEFFLSLGKTELLHLRPVHIAIANLWRKAAHKGLGIRMAWCMQMLLATYHGVFKRVR